MNVIQHNRIRKAFAFVLLTSSMCVAASVPPGVLADDLTDDVTPQAAAGAPDNATTPAADGAPDDSAPADSGQTAPGQNIHGSATGDIPAAEDMSNSDDDRPAAHVRPGPPFAASAAQFPSLLRGTLTPPAPFPIVISGVAHPLTTIAPGVRTFAENLVTTLGPLVVHGVLIDPRTPGVEFRTVLAHDRIVSNGETVSSMAHRTGAVAGINGDYFDIHQTNEPLGIVVRDGLLLRTPSRRVALAVHDDDTIRISPFALHGTVTWDAATVALTGINSWPPDGGASLILPNYGAPAPRANVKFVRLQEAVLTGGGATYRVVAPATNYPLPNTLGLALGPAALGAGQPPDVGDTIVIQQNVDPSVDDLMAAIGGGPQLLAEHEVTHDAFDPLDDESGRRFPLSGLGRLDDGELVMLTVDGRAPTRSVGLTRPEFGALFAALGTADAMCLDSGGSTELVARLPGQMIAQVQNHPSDGKERPIGDGFFVYSRPNGQRALPATKAVDDTDVTDPDADGTGE